MELDTRLTLIMEPILTVLFTIQSVSRHNLYLSLSIPLFFTFH